MRPRIVAIAMAVLALVVASCSDAPTVGDRGSPAASADEREVAAYLALCSARDEASANEVGTAEATFEDEAHEALHHLAEEVEGTDRAASAALLRAKSDVEADFAEEAPEARTVHGHVEALLDAMRGALEVVGVTAPECPETQR
ncbi:MAG TPA: hypothetical protein VFZ96_07605 [Actinomycetota bacterium]|nr:hypothetical protein [Actinomycetota bacterium]